MSGLASLPYTDDVEFDEIDIVLITHFHLDHCGALPWLMNTDEVRWGPKYLVPAAPPPHHTAYQTLRRRRPVRHIRPMLTHVGSVR